MFVELEAGGKCGNTWCRGTANINVNGPRYGAIWGADRRLLGLNNIELITDRPLEINLKEMRQIKKIFQIERWLLRYGTL